MTSDVVRPTVVIDRHDRYPIHLLIAPFAIACLVGTLLTDIAYSSTANLMWARFSTWLVSAGAILAVLTAIAGLVDIFARRTRHRSASIWPYVIGTVVILILAILNMLMHTRDAWTSVVPWGLTLSVITAVVIALTAWLGWSVVYRDRVGVAP